MSLADDLLEQAEVLANREPKKPKQVSLRRAASAAYYALFHRLIEEATGLFVREDFKRQALIARTFDHGKMKKVCAEFKKNNLPEGLRLAATSYQAPAHLKTVAETFIKLQQLRHEADYNLDRSFTRPEVRQVIQETQSAFTAWNAVRSTDDARLFLACFLLWETWNNKVRT